MNSTDIFKMSVRNLWRRKLRTVLTLLGVIIGTASIVVMVSLGIGMERSFKEEIANMGDLTIIDVDPYGVDEWGQPNATAASNKKKMKLDDKALTKFKKMPGVVGVLPMNSSYLRLVSGKLVADVNLVGISAENMEVFGFKIAEGRTLASGDHEVLVFGSDIPSMFRNPRLLDSETQNMPSSILLNELMLTTDRSYGERRRPSEEGRDNKNEPIEYKVRGIGILKQSNSEKDYNVYTSIDFMTKIKDDEKRNQRSQGGSRDNEGHKYQRVQVKVGDLSQVAAVQEQIRAMGFGAFSLGDILNSMEESSRKLQAVLGGIGAVSLLVAAIGIANTMIMSIYERTREIGVMKVIGAQLKDIKFMFLAEAALIGLVGGLLGLIVSYGISSLLNATLGKSGIAPSTTSISVIPWELAVGALLFSALVGLISGYSPARRAMRLSALEAIKNE